LYIVYTECKRLKGSRPQYRGHDCNNVWAVRPETGLVIEMNSRHKKGNNKYPWNSYLSAPSVNEFWNPVYW